MVHKWCERCIALLVLCSSSALQADALFPLLKADQSRPVIVIIIDDLGNHLDRDQRAINLHGSVTYSILPHSPNGLRIAEQAHQLNRDVMLHLPMQSIYSKELDEGGLTVDMGQAEIAATFHQSLLSVPYAIGVNNHMGSLFTRDKKRLGWLMAEIRRHDDLFFVDSRTIAYSRAFTVASDYRVPALARDVFLDHRPTPGSVGRQFQLLLSIAYKKGFAVAIGHPYQITLDFLEKMLPRLEKLGVRLVGASELIASDPVNLRYVQQGPPPTLIKTQQVMDSQG